MISSRRSAPWLGVGPAAALLGAVCLGGCASDLGRANALADAGVRLTSSFQEDVSSLQRQLEEGDATTAFTQTWNGCSDSPSPCVPSIPTRSDQEQRAELAAVVASRAQAVAGLRRAYLAFQAELGRRSGADVEKSVGDAISAIWSYAGSLTPVRLGERPGFTLPLERSVGYVASVGAAHRRRQRVLEAGEKLSTAVQDLRDALVLETRMYDDLAEALIRERVEAHKALLQAKLVSGAATLKPMADGLGLGLVRDADVVIQKSPATRLAVEAVIEASARADVRETQAAYRAAVRALDELHSLHTSPTAGSPRDLDRVERLLASVEPRPKPAKDERGTPPTTPRP